MTTKEYRLALPLASTVSHSKLWHLMHTGAGGWRSVWQSVQRWISSLPCSQPSQKKRVSSLLPGSGRLALGASFGLASALGASGRCAGLNLNTRNSWRPTSSSPAPFSPRGEEGHQYGHEEPGTRRRPLFLLTPAHLPGEEQTFAAHHRRAEGRAGVNRHHRRIAVGLDDLEDLKVVFLARALGEVFLVQPAHAPYL